MRARSVRTAVVSTAAMVMAAAATVMVTAAGVTIDTVAIRLALPDGPGLSGVCLYRDGADGRRRVVFKSVASARKKGTARDYAVAGELAADRVYEGTFVRLEDGDQVARFGCQSGRRFEIATPFVVPDRDLDTMLAVKESMEHRFGPQPSRQQPHQVVTAEHVSITLRGLRPLPSTEGGVTVVDVFQLYKKPGAPWTAAVKASGKYSAYPFARYALQYPAGDLLLADLPPDQMLAVKFRRVVPPTAGDGNLTEEAIFIYTGGLYPRGTANLTRMLQNDVVAGFATDDAHTDSDTDVAATSIQIDAKQAHRDSYGKSSINHRLEWYL